MPQKKINICKFFQNQKTKFVAFRERGKVNVLELKFRNFLKILSEIENHLEYESELKKQNVCQNFVDFYNPEKYLPKLNSKILKSFSDDESCLKFFHLVMNFDYSEFSHIDEKIYSELLFKMISLAAENNSSETSVLIRKIYEFRCVEADSRKIQNFITKMLQIVKNPMSDEENEKEVYGKNKNNEEKSEPGENTSETEKISANGIKLIKGLLFIYNIDDENSLRRNISKTGIFHFALCVILPLILGAAVFSLFMQENILNFLASKIADKMNSPSKEYIVEIKDVLPFIEYLKWIALVPFIFAAVFNFRSFLFRRMKIRYLKKAISKIASAAEIAEDFIFDKIQLRYGEKIKKFLQ